jgi:hypothetical protein
MSVLNYGVEAMAQPSDFPYELIANKSIAGILGFCNLFCTNMNDIVVELLIAIKLFCQIDRLQSFKHTCLLFMKSENYEGLEALNSQYVTHLIHVMRET